MDTLVVTSCTGRKRAPVPLRLRALPSQEEILCHGGGLAGLAAAWNAEVRDAMGRSPVLDMYAGRTILDAVATTRALKGHLYVVSAGLGLLGEADHIPSYTLTVAQGAESVLPALEQVSASVADWWTALNRVRHGNGHPLSTLLQEECPGRVLLALPARYLEMVATDLACVPSSLRGVIRIFTSPAGRKALPEEWRSYVMPYDERLDGEGSPCPGTRTDFAQRAMRHFVEELQGARLPLVEAQEAVTQALTGMKTRTAPQRRRASDDEVLALLQEHWTFCDGQSSRLLRFLRDEALVSCEQSRFRTLWTRLRADMEAARESRT